MTASKLIKHTAAPIATPEPTAKPQTFREAFAAVSQAFVSIAPALRTPQTVEAIARRFPDWKLKYFEDFEVTGPVWRKNLTKYLGLVDALVIVIDDSRIIGTGIIAEMITAKRLSKFLTVFNLASGRFERYSGWRRSTEGRGGVLLEEKARSTSEAKPKAA